MFEFYTDDECYHEVWVPVDAKPDEADAFGVIADLHDEEEGAWEYLGVEMTSVHDHDIFEFHEEEEFCDGISPCNQMRHGSFHHFAWHDVVVA